MTESRHRIHFVISRGYAWCGYMPKWCQGTLHANKEAFKGMMYFHKALSEFNPQHFSLRHTDVKADVPNNAVQVVRASLQKLGYKVITL